MPASSSIPALLFVALIGGRALLSQRDGGTAAAAARGLDSTDRPALQVVTAGDRPGRDLPRAA